MLRTKSFPAHFKADLDDPTGEFEAIVAVFGNVDFQGDRIIDGAFSETLKAWKATGDPIPVIHSHQWYDLDAHIGGVDPKNAEELSAGDDRLPDSLKELGGLYVKGNLDVEVDPAAAKVHRLMAQRRLREFSFAYDILEDGEKRADDGVNELLGLDLIEVGPTLKGANPATALIGAKDLEGIVADDGKVDLDALAKAINGVLPGGTTPVATKAHVTLEGSIETQLTVIATEVRGWAGELFGDDLYWVFVEATMPDSVLAYVELWEEPLQGGTFYQIPYTLSEDDDGDQVVALGEPQAVALQLTTVPKAYATLPRAKAEPGNPAVMRVEIVPDIKTAEQSLADAELIASVRAELAELPA